MQAGRHSQYFLYRASCAPGTNISPVRVFFIPKNKYLVILNGDIYSENSIYMPQDKPKNLKIGVFGEEVACRYLKAKGYKILERNFSNTQGIRLGEIDIIALYKGNIVFVEVKTRRQAGAEALLPEANINRQKLHKLNKIAQVYLREKKMQNRAYQFDAVSILYNEEDKKALVKHLESIFI